MKKLALPALLLGAIAGLWWCIAGRPDDASDPGEHRGPGTGNSEAAVEMGPDASSDDVAVPSRILRPSMAQQEGAEVQVYVGNVRGDPLPGARVTILSWSERGELATTEHVAETDAAGKAAIPLPAACDTLFDDNDALTLMAQCEGYAPSVEEFFWPRECRFTLADAVSIFGRVLEYRTNAPVGGARLVFGFSFQVAPGSAMETVTDPEGWYRFDGAPSDAQACVTVLRNGFWRHQVFVDIDAHGGRVDLHVPSGCLFRGRVVDAASGDPLVGVEIRDHVVVTESDASGRFAVRGPPVPSGEAVGLQMRATGHCFAALLIDSLAVEADAQERLVALVPTACAEGVVVDTAGAPVPGALVWPEAENVVSIHVHVAERYPAFPWDGVLTFLDPSVSAETDAQGRFRLDGVGPSRIRVHARHGSLDTRASSGWIDLAEPQSVRGIVLTLDAGAIIEGRVQPADSRWEVGWAGRTMHGQATVDGDGSYRLIGVETGTVRVGLLAPDRDPFRTTDESLFVVERVLNVVAGRRHVLDLVAPPDARPGAIVAGSVVGCLGEPRADVEVEFYGDTGIVGSGETDAHGRFEIEVATPEGAELRALYGSLIQLRLEAMVAAGSKEATLVLPAASKVSLRVVDRDTGAAIPEARLEWSLHAPAIGETVHGEVDWQRGPDGDDVVCLPIGVVALSASAEGYGYDRQRVEDLIVSKAMANMHEVRLARTQ